MIDIKYTNSSFITNSIVERRSNLFFERFIGIFFRNLDLDKESLLNLKESDGKGKRVYVSYQSSTTSLLVFINILRRHGLLVPVLALEFTPYLLQIISSTLKRTYRGIYDFFHKRKSVPVSDLDCIKAALDENTPLIISLLSKKFFLSRYMEVKTDILQDLIEIQKKTDEPIFLYPKITFWNSNPERTKTFLAMRATGDLGFLSAAFAVLKSLTPSFIRISPPINLKQEMADSASEDSRQMARNLRNRLLEIYNREKRAILGPVIKTQQEMMEKVLYHRNIIEVIESVGVEEGKSEKRLRKKAYRYYREIAADFSIIFIKFFNWSVQDILFKKIFDSIHFNIEDLKKVREASQKGPLIIMPCHKSHMDYLLVSSIFYMNKIIPPHIVAGVNLTFFPMGQIFRRCGAFFMRRSFKGLALYSAIFKQYIKTLINEGYSIEFFIEGGRTRTGKVSLPKMGILKYLMDAIEEGYNKDMVFVPVSINYDRILEESSYHMELKGKEKKKESTAEFVKSKNLLKRKYGSVYLEFSDPICFSTLRESIGDGPELMNEIAMLVVKKVNEKALVTPFAMASSVLLNTSSRGFSRDILKNGMIVLRDYFKFTGASFTRPMDTDDDMESAISNVIDSYKNDRIIGEIKFDPSKDGSGLLEGVYVLNEEDRSRINFYRNNIIHYALPMAFICLALMKLDDRERKTDRIKDEYVFLKGLFSNEYIYSDENEDVDGTFEKYTGYMERCSAIRRDGARVEVLNRDLVAFFAKFLEDIFESYLVVLSTVAEARGRPGRKELMGDIRKNGIRMLHLGEINLAESLSMPNYGSAVEYLSLNGMVRIDYSSKKNEVTLTDAGRIREAVAELKSYLKSIS
ncbi:MAG: 1-acyl-sn-glycerol-3-phosphate acyltransferase [Spirochaetes bacterium]|jgi:glycerol-3-phosphate O-acyltransferase|nr:1-acyl-sn-glycerol-3-phosphate acyltransferase [Spirochaetota bacterium]